MYCTVLSAVRSTYQQHASQPPNIPLKTHTHSDVLAELLGVPEKVNWKHCELSKPEEQAMVEALKLAYAPYDFNETQEEEED